MSEALFLWVAAAGVFALLVVTVVLGLRRSRREAARRRQAEQAAVELALRETARLAAERAATQHAEAEARAAVEAAYREGTRLAAAKAAHDAAQRAAERDAAVAAEARAAAEHLAALEAELAARREAEAAATRVAAEQAALEAAAAATAPPAPTPAAPPAAPRTPPDTLVMVADDSKVVRVKTSRLLAQHGYRVVLAENGQQAAQLIEQEVPVVLVTDVEMPLMDGFELTRHVRRHPLARHIPIIMITSADERLKAVAADAGVTLVLGKPYAEDLLLACVAQAMAGEDLRA